MTAQTKERINEFDDDMPEPVKALNKQDYEIAVKKAIAALKNTPVESAIASLMLEKYDVTDKGLSLRINGKDVSAEAISETKVRVTSDLIKNGEKEAVNEALPSLLNQVLKKVAYQEVIQQLVTTHKDALRTLQQQVADRRGESSAEGPIRVMPVERTGGPMTGAGVQLTPTLLAMQTNIDNLFLAVVTTKQPEYAIGRFGIYDVKSADLLTNDVAFTKRVDQSRSAEQLVKIGARDRDQVMNNSYEYAEKRFRSQDLDR